MQFRAPDILHTTAVLAAVQILCVLVFAGWMLIL